MEEARVVPARNSINDSETNIEITRQIQLLTQLRAELEATRNAATAEEVDALAVLEQQSNLLVVQGYCLLTNEDQFRAAKKLCEEHYTVKFIPEKDSVKSYMEAIGVPVNHYNE